MFGRKHKFEKGEAVKAVGATFGWGEVEKGDIGFITETEHLDGNDKPVLVVAFGSQRHWHAMPSDLKLAEAWEYAGMEPNVPVFEVGSKVRIISAKHGFTRHTKEGDVGIIVGHDIMDAEYILVVGGRLFLAEEEDLEDARDAQLSIPSGKPERTRTVKKSAQPGLSTAPVLGLPAPKKAKRVVRANAPKDFYKKLIALSAGESYTLTSDENKMVGTLDKLRGRVSVWSSKARKTGEILHNARYGVSGTRKQFFIHRVK